MGENKKGIKRAWKAVLILLVILLLTSAVSALLSTYGLTVTYYKASSKKLTEPVRIVHLTDLHNSVFGKENCRLVNKVAAQDPDLILISGDLLNQNEKRTDIAENLIQDLVEIAPVYVSLGNHEAALEKQSGTDIKKLYSDAGAEVLEFSSAEVTVKSQHLLLCGFYGYGMPARFFSRSEEEKEEVVFLQSMENRDDYTILLCHMPVSWLRLNALEEWHFDCVLCGHVHGGQIRFPLIGGLWAPDQGWFPGKECGMYISQDGSRFMELSRGLGNTEKIPRFNNIPEIVVLDLIPENNGEKP